ncbi:MAG: RIP metalloprotease RseP [Candidatus Amulumruptor caecigallinarius]|nr:RIP metalloprotease RseP [Candidatus Amulumruptor caecigallinarius]
MDTFLIKAAQLILAFAILVIIHEFGHFLFARIFGIKVEKFYIFFDPWTELFKWKPGKYFGFFGKTRKLKKQANGNDSSAAKEESGSDAKECEEKGGKSFWGNTEYGVGWLPLGGYCKIAGMIDESMDTEQMKLPPKEWEFRAKPAWQRLLVMIAGVLFNFLLAILIYAGIVYATGEKYVPFSEAKMGMTYSPAAHKVGFEEGDVPLMADGKALTDPMQARMDMMQAKVVSVLRNGKDTVNISIPEKFMFELDREAKSDSVPVSFFTYRFPARVTQVVAGEGAAKADIRPGDDIVAVDSVKTPTLIDFLNEISRHPGKTVSLKVARGEGEQRDTIVRPVKLSEASKMGIALEVDPSNIYKYKEIKYGLFESVPRGVQLGTDRLVSYVKSMGLVFTKEGAQSIGGFGSIGSIFPEKWDWIAFWNIAAFLSVALAFMNILPIPALDGGHVMFLLYEVIFRRKPSDKFLERAQIAGMVLLILLLVYANGMDIIRLFK